MSERIEGFWNAELIGKYGAAIDIVIGKIREIDQRVYELAGEIRKINQFKIIKEKDYIEKPKVNGYQSYHMILEISGVKVELQIRTLLMDAWSSLETILIYKKTTPLPEYMEKDIQKFSKWSRKMDSLVEKILERKDVGL